MRYAPCALVLLVAYAWSAEPRSFSGIYPHLAMANREGECGTGAVVPWAGRLWVITYGPHLPNGSTDKLYEIAPDLSRVIRPESVGGTPADRLIHRETNQLVVGPYVIDAQGGVRVVTPKAMPGRLTAAARHLTDPEHQVYIATMEEGIYSLDLRTLTVTTVFPDVQSQKFGLGGADLPGYHGKGLYSGQGVLVYANNGEKSPAALVNPRTPSGVLAEWNGATWKVIRRNQFTDVTGPGGILGNTNAVNDPLWSIGWDHKSVLLALRDGGAWSFFRLPKASRSYDGAHGWNTEWPRIRDIGTNDQSDRLMTMHGMFWRFPADFTVAHHPGPRPRSAYLKVVGDVARWNDRVVLGCDDTAQSEFLNKRPVKGAIAGPIHSNSNLWFMTPESLDHIGPKLASGGMWEREAVTAGVPSDPFLFAGWRQRTLWLAHDDEAPLTITIEIDATGDGHWQHQQQVTIPAHGSTWTTFPETLGGEWLRVVADRNTAHATAFMTCADGDDRDEGKPDGLFTGLAPINSTAPIVGGLVQSAFPVLRVASQSVAADGTVGEPTAYELDEQLALKPVADAARAAQMLKTLAPPIGVVTVDQASVLVVDGRGRRWRLPKGDAAFDAPTQNGRLRLAREIATERDVFNCHGTIYELPAENADGFMGIRPVASHHLRITDFCSHRGMMVLTGIDPRAAAGNSHIITSADGQAAVWLGAIDDLWRLGRPTGRGGPWAHSEIKAGIPSDPYLLWGYGQRHLALSQDGNAPMAMRIELDVAGNGQWLPYRTLNVLPGATVEEILPDAVQARWLRVVADRDGVATVACTYR